MAVGIAAMVLLFGLGAGAERALEAALEQMGENLLAVGAERRATNALRNGNDRYRTLTLGDWTAIARELELVERAAPIAMSSVGLRYGGASVDTTVIGTTPELQLTNNQRLSAGRFLDADDVEQRRRVAVLGSEIARELFHGEVPLGARFLVGRSPFVVIGVLEEKGVDPTGSPQDDRILIPITTAMRRVLNVDHVDRIFVQARSRDRIDDAIADLRRLLRARHDLDLATRPDDFSISDQTGLLATLTATDRSLGRLLAGTAALTLGMAGLGLLAVSLLSVRERRNEIGLRRAVGALPRHILLQFLGESAMIAGLGAALGLLLGGLGGLIGAWWLGWALAFAGRHLLAVFSLALALSLGFGVGPAWHAARLDPIMALSSD